MKVYIAGKITGDSNYKQKFSEAETSLRVAGHVVLNPACLPDGFTWDDYMHICLSMIDVCDAVFFLSDWQESKGAQKEYVYALSSNKKAYFNIIGLVR